MERVPAMQVLKFVVVGMGVLIVLGLALVAYGLVGRVSKDDAGMPRIGDLNLSLPAGCAIADAEGDEGQLIIRTEGPEERGCQQVIVVDMASGAILGRIHGHGIQTQ